MGKVVKQPSGKRACSKKTALNEAKALRKSSKARFISTLKHINLIDLNTEQHKKIYRLVTKGTLANILPEHYKFLQLDGAKKIAKLLTYKYVKELYELARANDVNFQSKNNAELQELFEKHITYKITQPIRIESSQ